MRRNWCRQAFIFTSTDDPNVASFDVVLGKGGSGGGNALEEAFIFGTVVDAAERFYPDSLHLFPWMHWGSEHSIGHYLDLGSVILGLTLFPVGYLFHALAQRHA